MSHWRKENCARRATIGIVRPYFLDALEYEVRNAHAHRLNLRLGFRMNCMPLLSGRNWARGTHRVLPLVDFTFNRVTVWTFRPYFLPDFQYSVINPHAHLVAFSYGLSLSR